MAVKQKAATKRTTTVANGAANESEPEAKKRALAKRSTVKKTPAEKAAAKASTTKKATAKKTTATKAVAKKAGSAKGTKPSTKAKPSLQMSREKLVKQLASSLKKRIEEKEFKPSVADLIRLFDYMEDHEHGELKRVEVRWVDSPKP
jgi:hypothetical protein